ncbi:MAG TPA: hypothetical protein VMT02_04310 [Burkholderiales bacterium]|nr:hypothetical protein [Burkholderiales bacterium]
MGKLAERLGDPARAGIYRVETTEALEEASALNGYTLLRVRLNAESDVGALTRLAAEPSLDGCVALISGFEAHFRDRAAQRAALLAALALAAEGWRARGARVFVAFFDPDRELHGLAPLYNWHKSRSRPQAGSPRRSTTTSA